MALAWPRNLPIGGVTTQRFELKRSDLLSPEVSGEVGSLQMGFPRWYSVITIGAGMTRAKSGEWRAWINSLDGSNKLFYGWDTTREYPAMYPRGWAGLLRAGTAIPFPVDGLATDYDLSDDRQRVTLRGLPNGFKLTTGDLIGFRWGADKRALVEAQETVDANAVGTLSTDVRPSVSPVVPLGAEAYLVRPTCLMKLVPGEVDMGEAGLMKYIHGSFSSIQVMRA